MDVVQYTVEAYDFLITLIGIILRAMVGPLGIAVGALILLLVGAGLYLLLLRRPPRRHP
jgi:hypothetical protein